MAVEPIAAGHAERQVTLARRTSMELGRLWRQIDRSNIAASWGAQLPQALAVLGTSQATAAASAGLYVDDALEAQGIATGASGRIMPGAFAGIASDGRPLASLLLEPSITALSQIKQGASPARALNSGRFLLDMIARTQVADAGRVAVGTAIAARLQVHGYVRMVVGKTCSRCLILAGRRYEWNAGFKRHPRCFPAGVVVDGPRSEAATRRLYQGELVVLATASGQKLPLTGNHPVLTRRGWVPARLLQEGDEVVRRTRTEGATPLVVPDHHQMPARIEDVWGSLGVPFLDAVESSSEDFHGDGQHGQVDVVWADGALNGRVLAALAQHAPQPDLARTAGSPLALDGERAPVLLDLADAAHPGRPVSVDHLRPALLGRLLRGANETCLAHASPLYASLGEDAGNWPARDAVLLGEAEFAGSGQVGRHDRLRGQVEDLPRWDAPDGPLSVETSGGYAARGLDLLQRLAGQIEMDRLVEVRRVEWSGHVYSLTSSEGWHSASSLIVSNCDCRHVPVAEDVPGDVTTDPKAYFDSLDRDGQDQLLGKAGADAVREGADMAKVVNARRGMQTASIGGQRVLTTTEAAGRRPRLMPEAIFEASNGDRRLAVRLLKQHGYLST
jgi:hypothetical protein